MTQPTMPTYIAERVRFCEKAAVEAYHEIANGTKASDRAGAEASSTAYMNALPGMSSPEETQAFIACVARGTALGIISAGDASRLLYAAQCAIANRKDCAAA
jgi:hypothetical protein